MGSIWLRNQVICRFAYCCVSCEIEFWASSSDRVFSKYCETCLYPILVKTVEDITKLNPAKESALISGKLGNRKRLELLSLVQEKNITLSDGDVPSILNKIKSAFDTRKKLRQEKLNVKSKKEQEKEKQAAEQEKKVAEEKKSSESSVEEKVQQEEKKQKEQKSEAEKTIIKPQ